MGWVDKRTLLSAILSTAEASRCHLLDTGWWNDRAWPAGIHMALDVSWGAVIDEVIKLQLRGALPYGARPGGIKVK
jgi:hypothetical protein